MPVHGIDEAMGIRRTRLPLMVLIGGLAGAAGGFLLLYYITVIQYPHNVGGRPYFSWPAYVPVTFETTVLLAALTAVIGMLALNGLPRPHHPVFNAERFILASRNRFFLLIEAEDPRFDAEATRGFLSSLNPKHVEEVPW